MPTKKQPAANPKASRPEMPGYGISADKKDLLPWKWAEARLSNTKNYLLATARSDGRPHVMPIWGVWIASRFYFSTGKSSVKARNLASNPNCVLCAGTSEEAVMLEGAVEKTTNKKILAQFAKAYMDKYQWDVSEMNEPVFVVQPKVVFGEIEESFTKTATRWKFK